MPLLEAGRVPELERVVASVVAVVGGEEVSAEVPTVPVSLEREDSVVPVAGVEVESEEGMTGVSVVVGGLVSAVVVGG